MLEFQEDYYAVLGVEETATPEDIRKAYLKLAKRLHPDRFPNDPDKRAEAQAEFSRVTRAHEILGDPKQREEYDGLRTLTKNRAALDTGTPGTSAPAASAGGQPQAQAAAAEQKQEGSTKETWAQKHFARAEEWHRRQKYQEAETAIKEAIRLVPTNSGYHTKLAEIYLARGWKTLAQTEIQTALRLDPKDAEAKTLEMKMKAGSSRGAEKSEKKGFLDQLKEMLNKKG